MARSKKRGTAPAASARRWRLGAYIRLSKEDVSRAGDDSNSVIHQRALLDDYYRGHSGEFESAEAYIDVADIIGLNQKTLI